MKRVQRKAHGAQDASQIESMGAHSNAVQRRDAPPQAVDQRLLDGPAHHPKPMFQQTRLTVDTQGRGTYDLTASVQSFVAKTGIRVGLCHLFVAHTSASLILCENADPTVRSDLERYMRSTVPDGDPQFRHTAEGPDDMAAHVRTILTHSDLTVPVSSGRCALGTWQGLYLWEHRVHPHRRTVIVTVHGT